MSDEELLNYVRTHPHDKEAFHMYMDRFAQRPGVLCTTDEEIEAELIKRIKQKSQQAS